MKTTNTKRVATKTVKNTKTPDSTTKVAPNIGVLGNGMYKARKTVNGVSFSKNCPSLRKAKTWLKTLPTA